MDITLDTVQDYVNRIRAKYAVAGRRAGSKVDLLLPFRILGHYGLAATAEVDR